MEWPHWTVYIVLLGVWLWQNCVHELSHLLAIWHYHGKRPRGFYPYPHKHGGRFYFARFRCDPYRVPGHPLVYAAPLLGAAIQLGLAVVFISLFFREYTWHSLVVMLVPVVDAMWWCRGYFWGTEKSDGKRYKVALDHLINSQT